MNRSLATASATKDEKIRKEIKPKQLPFYSFVNSNVRNQNHKDRLYVWGYSATGALGKLIFILTWFRLVGRVPADSDPLSKRLIPSFKLLVRVCRL
jgi:hypothetical protein